MATAVISASGRCPGGCDGFVLDGFDVAMDAIAASAGVSKVTVYNHYGSKETLFMAVIGDALQEALADAISGTVQRLQHSDDLVAHGAQWLHGAIADGTVLPLRVNPAKTRATARSLSGAGRRRGPHIAADRRRQEGFGPQDAETV